MMMEEMHELADEHISGESHDGHVLHDNPHHGDMLDQIVRIKQEGTTSYPWEKGKDGDDAPKKSDDHGM